MIEIEPGWYSIDGWGKAHYLKSLQTQFTHRSLCIRGAFRDNWKLDKDKPRCKTCLEILETLENKNDK